MTRDPAGRDVTRDWRDTASARVAFLMFGVLVPAGVAVGFDTSLAVGVRALGFGVAAIALAAVVALLAHRRPGRH